jgi:hypothetical protein
LDKAGVAVGKDGKLECAGERTNVPHIYGIGDVVRVCVSGVACRHAHPQWLQCCLVSPAAHSPPPPIPRPSQPAPLWARILVCHSCLVGLN